MKDGFHLSTEHKSIATSMYETFKKNRCKEGNTEVSDRLRKRVHSLLSVILGGPGDDFDSLTTVQLVFTQVFYVLLFSTRGLWMRTTLDMIQEFVSERLETLGVQLKDPTVLDKNYKSFVDFVLMSRDSNGLVKDDYMQIANVTAVRSVDDSFESFPIKQWIDTGRLTMINLHIKDLQSTFFFSGFQR